MIQKVTLLEFNKLIQSAILNSFPESVWIVAEISELKFNRNGHCYLELIEKDVINENIIARTRATIWAFTFRMLKPYFESATGQELTTGIKVLVKAKVEFHELYGLSLNITDIDPNYTIGDLAQKKNEIINKLLDDGVLDMNKEVSFPLVPQKIAIISSETAAGYQDFMDQLKNNSFGIKFYTKLFPSVMQGFKSEESIISSLDKIYQYESFFDLVVIIRGGGSQADLNCFNSYLLAANVAQFSLPILTGIGHEKDESVLDIVAHKKLKTPTAVAEFIMEKIIDFEDKLGFLKNNFANKILEFVHEKQTQHSYFSSIAGPLVKSTLNKKKSTLNLYKEKIKRGTIVMLNKKSRSIVHFSSVLGLKSERTIHKSMNVLINLENQLNHRSVFYTKKHTSHIINLESKLELLNPINILKRGYSITYLNGKRLTCSDFVQHGDEVLTKLFDGKIRSTVKEKTNGS